MNELTVEAVARVRADEELLLREGMLTSSGSAYKKEENMNVLIELRA